MRDDKENLIVKLTFDFALQILKCTRELQRSHDYSLADQLLRSGISIGANVREAQNAESKADFIHKMKIAAKEADEVEYYLQLIHQSDDLPIIELPLEQIQSIIKNHIILKICIMLIPFSNHQIIKSNNMLDKTGIAKRIAKEIKDGYYVNLGIGIPTLVANYIPEGINVVLQSENGLLGMGPFPFDGEEDPDLINAGKQTITTLPGSAIFDSAMSFGMIRSQKVDLTILGAMEVSENGDIANWKIPGKMVKGMGGAMDLVASAKNIIVAMQHVNKAGESKLLTQCSLPLTGVRCVKKIVTELAVLEIAENGGFRLLERAPGVSVEEIKNATSGKLIIEGEIPEMTI